MTADSSRVCTSKQNVVSQDVCAHSIPKERTVAGSGVIKRGRIGGESANGLVSLKNRVPSPGPTILVISEQTCENEC